MFGMEYGVWNESSSMFAIALLLPQVLRERGQKRNDFWIAQCDS